MSHRGRPGVKPSVYLHVPSFLGRQYYESLPVRHTRFRILLIATTYPPGQLVKSQEVRLVRAKSGEKVADTILAQRNFENEAPGRVRGIVPEFCAVQRTRRERQIICAKRLLQALPFAAGYLSLTRPRRPATGQVEHHNERHDCNRGAHAAAATNAAAAVNTALNEHRHDLGQYRVDTRNPTNTPHGHTQPLRGTLENNASAVKINYKPASANGAPPPALISRVTMVTSGGVGIGERNRRARRTTDPFGESGHRKSPTRH
jgi:hypothetical protein